MTVQRFSQERKDKANSHSGSIESFFDFIEPFTYGRIESVESSLYERLHAVGEFKGLSLIRPGTLRIFWVARPLEFRLNNNEAIVATIEQQGIDAPIISAIDERANPDSVLGRAKPAN